MTATTSGSHPFTDEQLVAFADGELDLETTEQIEAALETDPALAERIEMFMTSRTVLKKVFDPIAREPVPEHLTRFVMSNGTQTMPAARTSERVQTAPAASAMQRAASRWSMPIAAALALAVGIGGYLGGRLQGDGAGSHMPIGIVAMADPVLDQALSTAADSQKRPWSNSGRAGEVELRESYKTARGYCRSFGINEGGNPAYSGVSCRTGEGWRVEVIIAEAATGGEFAPASGMAKAVDAFLEAAEAGDPLDAAAVTDRIQKGWSATE